MFAIQNGLRNTFRSAGIIARANSNSIVSAPPEVRISTAEKLFALFCISGSILFVPMYMIPNFKNYGSDKI